MKGGIVLFHASWTVWCCIYDMRRHILEFNFLIGWFHSIRAVNREQAPLVPYHLGNLIMVSTQHYLLSVVNLTRLHHQTRHTKWSEIPRMFLPTYLPAVPIYLWDVQLHLSRLYYIILAQKGCCLKPSQFFSCCGRNSQDAFTCLLCCHRDPMQTCELNTMTNFNDIIYIPMWTSWLFFCLRILSHICVTQYFHCHFTWSKLSCKISNMNSCQVASWKYISS